MYFLGTRLWRFAFAPVLRTPVEARCLVSSSTATISYTWVLQLTQPQERRLPWRSISFSFHTAGMTNRDKQGRVSHAGPTSSHHPSSSTTTAKRSSAAP